MEFSDTCYCYYTFEVIMTLQGLNNNNNINVIIFWSLFKYLVDK